MVEIAAATTGETSGPAASGTTDALTIVALIVGAIGVVLGSLALLQPRRA